VSEEFRDVGRQDAGHLEARGGLMAKISKLKARECGGRLRIFQEVKEALFGE